ncbi:MAG: hypothetical protein ABJA76_00010 [Mucilaginibacter sp.]
MTTNLLYSLKIWLTSVLLAPIFYLIIMDIKKFAGTQQVGPIGEMYFLLTIFGLLFSFVTWFIFFILIMLISSYAPNEITARLIICVTGIVLVLATFMLTIFNHRLTNDGDFIYLVAANCICIGAGSWIYKLKLYKHPEPDAQINP